MVSFDMKQDYAYKWLCGQLKALGDFFFCCEIELILQHCTESALCWSIKYTVHNHSDSKYCQRSASQIAKSHQFASMTGSIQSQVTSAL